MKLLTDVIDEQNVVTVQKNPRHINFLTLVRQNERLRRLLGEEVFFRIDSEYQFETEKSIYIVSLPPWHSRVVDAYLAGLQISDA